MKKEHKVSAVVSFVAALFFESTTDTHAVNKKEGFDEIGRNTYISQDVERNQRNLSMKRHVRGKTGDGSGQSKDASGGPAGG